MAMTINQSCRATLIAAPGSGQGKTLFTAALARQQNTAGKKVQVFKVGPDYLDPMILEVASGRPAWNLDWWMMGEQACRQLLHQAATQVDVILVEGLMGLYDNQPSNAWLAKTLGLPVSLIMDMAKFAQTAAAVVHGMQQYDPDLVFSAVIGNRLGSEHHRTLVREAMPAAVPYAGSLRRDDRMVLPERHLGLVQAGEIADLSARLDAAAACISESELDFEIPRFAMPAIESARSPEKQLSGKSIAVARDRALGFIYPQNIALLLSLGASIRYFSPLANEAVPDCDALWLPGGYPELFLDQLATNTTTLDSLSGFIASGKPGLAECGGMMLLGRSVTSAAGEKTGLAGAFAADFTMTKRFQSVGYQKLETAGTEIRGHSFHHSCMETGESPVDSWRKRDGAIGEGLFRAGGMWLSYAHACFSSSPDWTAKVFSGRLE